MKKNGFVFLETIVVLSVLMITLIGIYTSYNFIINNSKSKIYYDNINDVYKVNIVKKLISNLEVPTNENYKILENTTCTSSMNADCTAVLGRFNVNQVVIISNVVESINSPSGIKNSMKAYLRTLDKEKKHLVVSFNRNDKIYYASIEI
ncbi:MAG: hypothetical protein RSB41_03635 [Bacilli bacterium]